MSEITDELKRCPFCGGDPVQKWVNSTPNHFIECTKCGCKTAVHLASHGGSAKDDWNTRAATPSSQSLTEEENADIIPDLDMLSPEERKALLTKAENLWKALQENNIGGYSGVNRPFYILEAFRSVIEDFGKRNTGYRHSKNEIDSHLAALSVAKEPT